MQTTLIFPDATSLAEFIIANNIKKAEVESRNSIVAAELNDDEILMAVADFDAEVLPLQNYLTI